VERFICIHGHFYQPPRENPWLEAVEIQDSAYPYHDWNERVCSECYAPNAVSRILDGEERIMSIVSNYARISFNFGPTLLSWMETNAPETYRAILDADMQSIGQRSGHGNAIAQCYNHIIMPLADSRDKYTQILWGIKDFEHRFKRFPEGMWLPETAVDIETLDILAESGIKFTVLGPHQASKVRRTGAGKWKDVSGGQIDPTRPYLCRLPSNRRINIFFYDGQISRATAFEEQLLNKGEDFVTRLMTGFSDRRQWPQILNVAADGETYGHHHKFGDMALAYALTRIEENGLGRLTNYGEYLEKFPPTHEVEIGENTSWSCAHGIERWRSNCGCNAGKNSGWNQEWRKPLRDSLDWLRDELAQEYDRKGKEYLKDPWKARDEYIGVILDRSEENREQFIKRHALRDLTADEKSVVLKLMESQRHAMLMYTSCGWFFDELSGIETVQVLQYAGRTIQLSEGLLREGIEGPFLERLTEAKSNLAEHKDGAHIYETFVKTAMIDLKKVAAHYALSSTITDYESETKIYCYHVRKDDYQKTQMDKTKLIIGRIGIVSDITLESENVGFCVLHLGGHLFNGGVKTFSDDEGYQSAKGEISATFEKGEFAEAVRTMDTRFGAYSYSLVNLFRDEQRRIITIVMDEKMEEFANAYRTMYENNNVLAVFLHEAGIPIPEIFLATAEFILNFDVREAFLEEKINEEKILSLLNNIKKWNIPIHAVELEFVARRTLEGLMYKLFEAPTDLSLLSEVQKMVELVRELPFVINLWQAQNVYYKMSKIIYTKLLSRAKSGDGGALQHAERFKQVGQGLFFNTDVILGGE
jgi:alpha-amylase/alpha-mannosidase (GH57 family)